jgi:hypothetical protein
MQQHKGKLEMLKVIYLYFLCYRLVTISLVMAMFNYYLVFFVQGAMVHRTQNLTVKKINWCWIYVLYALSKSTMLFLCRKYPMSYLSMAVLC